jgi:hypothetical protein
MCLLYYQQRRRASVALALGWADLGFTTPTQALVVHAPADANGNPPAVVVGRITPAVQRFPHGA